MEYGQFTPELLDIAPIAPITNPHTISADWMTYRTHRRLPSSPFRCPNAWRNHYRSEHTPDILMNSCPLIDDQFNSITTALKRDINCRFSFVGRAVVGRTRACYRLPCKYLVNVINNRAAHLPPFFASLNN